MFFLLKASGDDRAPFAQGFDQVDVVEIRNRSRSWNAYNPVGVGEKHEETLMPLVLALVAEAKPFGIEMVDLLPAFGVDAPGFLPSVIAVNDRMGVDAVIAHLPASSHTLSSAPALKFACVHRYLQ